MAATSEHHEQSPLELAPQAFYIATIMSCRLDVEIECIVQLTPSQFSYMQLHLGDDLRCGRCRWKSCFTCVTGTASIIMLRRAPHCDFEINRDLFDHISALIHHADSTAGKQCDPPGC